MITATPKERAYSALATGTVPAARSVARAGKKGAVRASRLNSVALLGLDDPFPRASSVARTGAPRRGTIRWGRVARRPGGAQARPLRSRIRPGSTGRTQRECVDRQGGCLSGDDRRGRDRAPRCAVSAAVVLAQARSQGRAGDCLGTAERGAVRQRRVETASAPAHVGSTSIKARGVTVCLNGDVSTARITSIASALRAIR